MRIFLPGELTEQGALLLVGTLARIQHEEDEIILDFSRLGFAYPFGTALLAEAIRETVAERRILGLPVRWAHAGITKGLVSRGVSYLGHMGFFRHISIPYGNEPGEASGSRTYIPLTVVRRPSSENVEFHETIRAESRRLASMVFRDEPKQIMLTYCFQEIMRNAFEHAEVDECVIIAQKWMGQDVEIAVVDRGRGIQASLRERYGELSGSEALEKAIRPGVSRVVPTGRGDQWENTGFGLFVLSELGKRVGNFSVVSSGAYLHLNGAGRSTSACPYPGTGTKVRVATRDAEYFPNLLEAIVREGEEQSGSRASGASKRAT
jgi:anti-sigma regulatory factor (Ser/Thr protein kinase)